VLPCLRSQKETYAEQPSRTRVGDSSHGQGNAESLGAAQITQRSPAASGIQPGARWCVGRGWELHASRKFEGTSAIVFEPCRFRPGSTATRVFGAGPSRTGNPSIKSEVEGFSCAIRVYLEANHMAAASDQGQS
jgi:hypothetical protein